MARGVARPDSAAMCRELLQRLLIVDYVTRATVKRLTKNAKIGKLTGYSEDVL